MQFLTVVVKLKSSLQSKEQSSILENSDKLSKLLQEIGSSIYQQSAQPDVNQTSATDSSVDDNTSDSQEKVVDGEYDVVDDDNSPSDGK